LTVAAATRPGFAGCARAGWSATSPPELGRECGATLEAIKRVLAETPAPRRSGTPPLAFTSYSLLTGQFFLLLFGTFYILVREARRERPPPSAVLALLLVWGIALWLRLTLSPRTFLHEYYHVAETISGYLWGDMAPAYGKAGPALYRLVGTLLERPDDVHVIFVTNAMLASLAIPAVALLDLALLRSWPRAICAAVLLCVLPQHLRFSAAEDLFILAVTFGMWTLALFASYLRTRRVVDALCTAPALSLAMQTRPEMMLFPAVLVALVLLAEPRSWRVLFAWRTLLALGLAGLLLVPRFLDLQQALHGGGPAVTWSPELIRYVQGLVLFQPQVTPVAYCVLLLLGLAWGLRRKPGLTLWVACVFVAFTMFPFMMFGNPQYQLRAQLLPASFLVLIAAGAASLWMEMWGKQRRTLALAVGAGVLSAAAGALVFRSQGFVTELRDQQLEWAFLERTVPQLPPRATLLAAVEVGDYRLNAFPDFLLWRDGKRYEMIDVRRAAAGDIPWPAPGEELLFYQGMFCHFASRPDEPHPDPLSTVCTAVHQRYVAEPLAVEDLHTEGYSLMPYGPSPFRIGFFRLRAAR
jgi:hypothetical protein